MSDPVLPVLYDCVCDDAEGGSLCTRSCVTVEAEADVPSVERPYTDLDAQAEPHEGVAIRTFDTGATRNLDLDPDIHGFTSPLAMNMFARYMHSKRLQADGTMRASDNWKKGIPLDSYIRSLRRHLQDLELHHTGYSDMAREEIYATLGGLMFNVQGYMHELAKADIEEERVLEAIDNAVAAAEAQFNQGG